MAEKILNTRLKLKYDLLSNWESKNPTLLAGEAAVFTIATGETNPTQATPPIVGMKIGDGSTPFNGLPMLGGRSLDVYEWARAATKPEYQASEIKNLDTFIAGEIKDTDTQYKIVKVSDYQYKLMSKEKDASEYTTEVAVIDIPNDTSAISALQTLVGDTAVATQISTAIANLNLSTTYAAKSHIHTKSEITDFAHTHTKSEITDFAHTHTVSEITDFDSSVKAYDYATKSEAQGYANAKDSAITAAKQAGDDAQDYAEGVAGDLADEVSAREDADTAINNKIGTVPTGKTIVDMISDAQTAATYDDTAVKKDISDLAGLVGDTAVATQISTAVADEAEIARAAEKANADAIAAVKEDVDAFFKDADMTASAKDTLKELQEYIASDESGASSMAASIKANSDAIDAIEADYLKAADKTELSNAITGEADRAKGVEGGLETRLKAVEDDYLVEADKTALQNSINTKASQADLDTAEDAIDALELLVGDKAVATQITDAVTPVSNRVTTLEGDSHTHGNKTELDKIATGDKEKWDAKVDAVTAVANGGIKATKSGNSVSLELDDTLTYIFDCGNATI